MVEFLSFNFHPLITCGDYLQIYSSEMTKSPIFWIIRLGMNTIDVNMNKFSRKIIRGEGDIQVGEVVILLYSRYGSE